MTESKSDRIHLSLPGWTPGLVASLLINIALWGALLYLKNQTPAVITMPPLPVRVMSESDLENLHRFSYTQGERKIVQSDAVSKNDNIKADPFPAEYLGEKTQRVKRESLRRGEDPEGDLLGSRPSAGSRDAPLRKLFETTAVPSENAMKSPAEKLSKERPGLDLDSNGLGNSGRGVRLSVDDLGKNVEMGVKTLLNTDEYRFYTYVSRIKENIYPIWKKNLDFYGRQVSAIEGHYVVRGTMVMNTSGDFQRIEDWQPCGVGGFDRAVTEAFENLPRIPNPPSDMINDDQLVRLKFSFRIEHQPTRLRVEAPDQIQGLPRGRVR